MFTRDQIKNLKTKKNEPDESINYNGMNNIAVGGTPANVHALHHNDHECNSQVYAIPVCSTYRAFYNDTAVPPTVIYTL